MVHELFVHSYPHFEYRYSLDTIFILSLLICFVFCLKKNSTHVHRSDHDISPGSIQFNWMLQDLESVNRTQTPWLIVNLHRPLYTFCGYFLADQFRYDLERVFQNYSGKPWKLLLKGGVDVVLAGHVHRYSRTCPVYNYKCRGTEDNPGIMTAIFRS